MGNIVTTREPARESEDFSESFREQGNAVARSNARGLSLVAARALPAGTVLYSFAHLSAGLEENTHSVQVEQNQHIVDLEFLSKLNHSCDPSLIVDTRHRLCIAARDLAEGDELNYFYPSTDWTMSEPFQCQCGNAECIGRVNGARFLSIDVLSRYLLNEHILRMAMDSLQSL